MRVTIHHLAPFCLIAGGALTSACSQTKIGTPTTGFDIRVAPLELPGVSDACYNITVKNEAAQVVWSETGVCSSQYGDGRGAITYIGTCDASEPNHTVELTLVSLTDENDAPITEFVNPTAAGPLTLPAVCTENQDTRVTFNLVIMREANQGFLDIGVNFDDIFCSAKVDCSSPPLLFAPGVDNRIPTGVIGLACTGGPGADTHIYYSKLVLDCGEDVIEVPLTGAPGNQYTVAGTAPAPLGQVATYQGLEDLANPDGTSLAKAYFNVALGVLPGTLANCSLHLQATASDGPLDICTTPEATTYPIINIEIADFLSAGELACGENALNATPGTDVWTDYVEVPDREKFAVEAHATPTGLVVTPCPFCGDATTDADELCDAGPTGNASVPCTYGETTCTRCDASCAPVTITGTFCGDSIVQSPETCDAGAAGDDSVPCTYGQATCDRCTAACEPVTLTGTFCGDSLVQSPEACDEGAAGNANVPCAAGESSCLRCDATCAQVTVTGTSAPPPPGCIDTTGLTGTHTVELRVSCDNDCIIYLDGDYKAGQLTGASPWWNPKIVTITDVPPGCHVLGIEAADLSGVAAGIVGKILVDGVVTFVTGTANPAITINSAAPDDANGNNWSTVAYQPASPWPQPAQCGAGVWYATWTTQYYNDGAWPIWYNSQCQGVYTRAYARFVFTVGVP